MKQPIKWAMLLSTMLGLSSCYAQPKTPPVIPTYPASADFNNPSEKGSTASITFVKNIEAKYAFMIGLSWVVENDDPINNIVDGDSPSKNIPGGFSSQWDAQAKMDVSPFLVRVTRIESTDVEGSQKEVLVLEKRGDLMPSRIINQYSYTRYRNVEEHHRNPKIPVGPALYGRFIIAVPPQPDGLYRVTITNMEDVPFFKGKHIILTAESHGFP